MSYLPLKNFKSKEERAEYVKATLIAEGLKPLEDYKGNSIPMIVEIMEGQYKGYNATATWNNFIKGKRPDFRGLLEEERIRFIHELFEAEGYRVINIPKPILRRNKVDLLSPEGNEWSVAIDTFTKGVRCPLDSDRSWGERCVSTILKDNGIPFKSQYTIWHPDGSKQFMDFYIEYKELKFDVEYNGRQHYEEDPKNRLFLTLEEQRASDDKKRNYCKLNNIVSVEIPYTINGVNDIAAELKKYFHNIDAKKEYKVESYRYDEKAISEYYSNHTEAETSRKFNISGSTIKKIAKRKGINKVKDRGYSDEEILSYYSMHTSRETADCLGISEFIVENVARKNGFKKGKGYTENEVISYYLTHSLKETQSKFNIGTTTVTSIMRRNGIKKKRS